MSGYLYPMGGKAGIVTRQGYVYVHQPGAGRGGGVRVALVFVQMRVVLFIYLFYRNWIVANATDLF